MLQLFDYGNAIFWCGLLLTIFLACCEFFCNDGMNQVSAKYRVFHFPQYPRLQKVCRILFLISLVLVLFARVGVHWELRPHTLGDEFIRIMNVMLIYYFVVYAFVISFLWVAKYAVKALIMLLKFLFYTALLLGQYLYAWINETDVQNKVG